MRRSKQRQAAVFAIYQSDITSRELDDISFTSSTSDFSYKLASSVDQHLEELDGLISKYATNWSIDRIAPLDKAILRVALFEMLYSDELDVEAPIAAEGAIDEAVELAKEFCGDDSPSFINGLLAAALEDAKSSSSS